MHDVFAAELHNAVLGAVRARHLSLRRGLLGVARTAEALLADSSAGALTVSGDAALSNSLAGAVVAGNRVTLAGGGGLLLAARERLELRDGAAAVLVSGEAQVANSFVPLLLARRATLDGQTRVLLGPREAAALGAALGVAAALTFIWLRRHA